jgi:hypothetical protein
MEHISLGTDCAIAFQLSKHNYRKKAYPFDWTRTPSLKALTSIIKNNFEDFTENLIVKSETDSVKFPPLVNDQIVSSDSGVIETMLIKANKYGIQFCHDFKKNDDVTRIKEISDKYKRRCERFMSVLKNKDNPQFINFIRTESNVDKVSKNDILEFVKLIDTYLNNYKLTIVLHNAQKKEYNLCTFDHPKVRIYNDTSAFGGWKRPLTNWLNIFQVNIQDSINIKNIIKDTVQVVDLTNIQHYRTKVVVNMHDKSNNPINSYDDTISRQTIIDIANKIIRNLQTCEIDKINYIVVEESQNEQEYGIEYVFKNNLSVGQINEIIKSGSHNVSIHIVSYKIDQQGTTEYISKQTYFNDSIHGTQWLRHMNTFTQHNKMVGQVIRDTVRTFVTSSNSEDKKSSYIGIGGESSLYGAMYKDYFDKQLILSRREVIKNSEENSIVKVIDYNTFDMKECENIIDINNMVLLINNRRGLENLLDQVIKYKFKQIIYIGCKTQYIERDMQSLLKIYKLNKCIQLNVPCSQIQYVFNLYK